MGESANCLHSRLNGEEESLKAFGGFIDHKDLPELPIEDLPSYDGNMYRLSRIK